jgi:hypothetical protein
MKTVSVTDNETADPKNNTSRTSDKRVLNIKWEDSEWFRVWLQLAREERPANAVC